MAKKVNKPRSKPAAPPDAAAELEILHPERTASIAGRNLTMREYGFVEGLKLRPVMQPLLDDLFQVATESAALPDLESIMGILAAHHEAVIELMAQAADVEPDWVVGLGQQDGYHLMMLWWAVNGAFFINTVVQRMQAVMAVKAQQARAGQMSGRSSSSRGTSQTASADTPGDS